MTLSNKTEILGKGFLLCAVSSALLLAGCGDTTEENSSISEISSTVSASVIRNSAAHWVDSKHFANKNQQ